MLYIVQSDCRTANIVTINNMLASNETVYFVDCEDFVKHCDVAKIRKEFEKQTVVG